MWSPHLHCFLQFIPVFICPINSPDLMPSHACLTMALDDIESSFVDSPPSSITFLYVAFVSTASGINQSHRAINLPKLPAKAGCAWSQWFQILIPAQANDQSHFPNVVYTYRGSGGACRKEAIIHHHCWMFFSHSCLVHTSYSLIASVVVTVVKMKDGIE